LNPFNQKGTRFVLCAHKKRPRRTFCAALGFHRGDSF